MKKPTDLLVILTTAVLTAMIATPILHPAVSHAEGEVVFQNNLQVENRGAAYTLLMPASMPGAPLVTEGLELTLKAGQESYKPGEKPVLTLVAVNRTDKKCKTKAKVLMSSTELASRLSRSMPMPVALFEKEIEIEVAAGQTVSFPLETGAVVPGNTMISLTVSVGELFQHAGSFAVMAPVSTGETAQLDETKQVTGK